MKFGTKTIHAGVEPDPDTGAIMTPIYQTSTYVQSSPGKHKGFEYARTQNPTWRWNRTWLPWKTVNTPVALLRVWPLWMQ